MPDTCSVCGAKLTEAEIETAEETGGPAFCSVHAPDLLPVDVDDEEGEPAGSEDAVA